ncbi:MAG: DUF4922 domain-containing protein [Bacteroidales bacterium]|nr:DUF4922 domain-containing protein [Bacteroidales bacterium]
MIEIERFFAGQLAVWPDARRRYEELASAQHKEVTIGGRCYDVMFNPARMKSAAAKVVDGKVERPCFLCDAALPPEQQKVEIKVLPSGRIYNLMVNPYPITDRHFTLVSQKHERQSFVGRAWDMAFLADMFPDYLIFFNGANSGASAPDHMHFQAVPKELVPVTRWTWDQWQDIGVTSKMPQVASEEESDSKNIICWTDGADCHWLVIDRKCHRPKQYFQEGEEQVLISPAALEFCGLVPLARREDFEKMDAPLLNDIFRQCRWQEPMLHVGVMEGQQICFSAEERTHAVNYLGENRMLHVMDYGSNRAEKHEIEEYHTTSSPFTLEGVTIGKQFHWQQQEDQSFMGALRIIAREGELHAINIVPVEEYLKSVISSEMSATNNLELLKTHAIISRSWVLRQLKSEVEDRKNTGACNGVLAHEAAPNLIARIWDHDDHRLYDVCADDHCQRYQGITRQHSPLVAQAVEETRGMVLLDKNHEICDARFSKCCGGKTELFSTCWQDRDYDYLTCVDDPWCDTHDEKVLKLVLNDYDQRTLDFHDWVVRYRQSELSELLKRRLLAEFPDEESDEHRQVLQLGSIIDLKPLKRGSSGRIYLLEVVGEGGSVRIGKELLIRKALSETHLYSSAFDVEKQTDAATGEPVFALKGKGWGHGVGLCQIGAANMSQQGKKYREILNHYFPGATIEAIY